MNRKVLAAFLTMLFIPALAAAEGLEAGAVHLTVFGGAAMPITKYKAEFNDEKVHFGDVGATYGAQIMYHMSSAFGLGVEVSGKNFSKDKASTNNAILNEELKTSANLYQVMLAGKIVLAPESRTRFYIPLGIGMAKFKGKFEHKDFLSSTSETTKESSTKPSAYAGIGVESDLGDAFILGLEARYNGYWVDKDKFADTKYLSDASLMLKFGIKF